MSINMTEMTVPWDSWILGAPGAGKKMIEEG